ncbi:GDP-mannose transporter [Trifolium repens]|nr:GDP-mannose transporter [Trifolium repens]
MRCCPLRCFHEALLEEEVDLVEGLFTLQFGLHLSQEKLPICRKVEKRKGYSIVMNTWKRYDLLKQSIKHYSSCPRLESVHIVWSEPDPPSESLLKYLHQVVKSKSREGRYVKLRF